jgi:CheY-like chemotaxis protein
MTGDTVTRSWVVLVVDDEADNLGLTEGVLEFYGAKVHCAQSAEKGLDLLETVKPTFILLDLSMPDMDGWQMHKRLRANDATTHLPVIALTAHAMSGDKERVMKAGFDGYISKPINIETFISEIKSWLLDAKPADLSQSVEVKKAAQQAAEAKAKGDGLNVFIVEDEEDSAHMVGELLTYHGLNVRKARDGREALATLAEADPLPDVIVTDLALPGKDGWQLLKELRDTPATAGLPVVAITAFHSPTVADDARKAGFNGYFSKPVDAQKFVDKLTALAKAQRTTP